MQKTLLESYSRLFEFYKNMGEGTFRQLGDEQLFYRLNEESNSVAMIVQHLWGNMLSRWTDFLYTDGEKGWRDRDAEFEERIQSREEMIEKWNEGWKVLLDTIQTLTPTDLEKVVYIRNQAHTVFDAIHRQIAHYAYHVGQIVYLGKMHSKHWQSLSIPRGGSQSFNAVKFNEDKNNQHFTDEFLQKGE